MNIKKKTTSKILIILVAILTLTIISAHNKGETVVTNAQALSTKKIGWGIKRNDNHQQPDLGKTNKELLEKNKENAQKRYQYYKSLEDESKNSK